MQCDGSSGVGNISFGPGVTIKADTQVYQAGDGAGGGGTMAHVDFLLNAPVFQNTAGLTAPNSFTYRQDLSIASTDVPLIAPGAYNIRSDDGAVALPGLALPGTLDVVANGPITQVGGLGVDGAATFKTLNDAGSAMDEGAS